MSTRGHVPAENMHLWRQQLEENRELRHLQIAMIARAAASALYSGEEFPFEIPELPREDLTAPQSAVAADERLAFCREVLALRPDLFDTDAALPPAPKAPRVARLAGELFSRAAAGMAHLLPDAVPLYLSSLTELLEATAAGEADFALLPLEDAKGNRFLHFHEEFDRLELHISNTCDVLSEEEGRHMRFALISRLYDPKAAPDAQCVIECRVPDGNGRTLTELLAVAADAGLILRRSDALPDPHAEDSFIHYPVFLAPKGTALLDAYLRFFLPEVSVVGRYLHLKGME